MAILSSADFPSIRGALDSSLDAVGLSDAVIALPIYVSRAELLLLQRDPLAETRTGTEAQRIKLAAIFFAASLLAPAIPAITSLAGDQVKYTRTIDWNERAADLRSLAEAEINAVLFPDTQDDADRPTAFSLACSGRSWLPGRRPVGVLR